MNGRDKRRKRAERSDDLCRACIAPIECEGGMPGCGYPEAHDHGFACDKTCVYCRAEGIPVYDPEAHPNHREWTQWPEPTRPVNYRGRGA